MLPTNPPTSTHGYNLRPRINTGTGTRAKTQGDIKREKASAIHKKKPYSNKGVFDDLLNSISSTPAEAASKNLLLRTLKSVWNPTAKLGTTDPKKVNAYNALLSIKEALLENPEQELSLNTLAQVLPVLPSEIQRQLAQSENEETQTEFHIAQMRNLYMPEHQNIEIMESDIEDDIYTILKIASNFHHLKNNQSRQNVLNVITTWPADQTGPGQAIIQEKKAFILQKIGSLFYSLSNPEKEQYYSSVSQLHRPLDKIIALSRLNAYQNDAPSIIQQFTGIINKLPRPMYNMLKKIRGANKLDKIAPQEQNNVMKVLEDHEGRFLDELEDYEVIFELLAENLTRNMEKHDQAIQNKIANRILYLYDDNYEDKSYRKLLRKLPFLKDSKLQQEILDQYDERAQNTLQRINGETINEENLRALVKGCIDYSDNSKLAKIMEKTKSLTGLKEKADAFAGLAKKIWLATMPQER